MTWIAGEQRRGAGGADEQADLHLGDRHADVARGVGVAAGGEDPVAEAGWVSTQVATQATPIHQTIDIGMPWTRACRRSGRRSSPWLAHPLEHR